ncbi:twin-arginine translocation signal domain-containing protein [Halorubrum sp. Atlit-28R]|uniref:twin-arginine translocation signal domain-containing protein n=1 Tax=Halorubrum sp. Atlit-28R TaxID=2282129 RepID=UPI000EF25990|nr:twin-arginine translocation signal domain-containing protein [Halorubrum sp. Atlit-28R]RLM50612.1 hypothetical protein DVK06_10255 [Halorubrum sp. Atlit-28R]
MTRDSRSRRGFLAGLATAGAAAVAGCAASPLADGETNRGEATAVPPGLVDAVEWPPAPFPATVPDSLAAAHQSRARDLLDAVPAEPSLPNAAVAAAIADDRARAVERVDAEPTDPWPTEALAARRRARGTAATVRGAYRAATGVDESADLAARRRTVREDRAALAAGLEYRAESTAAAALAYEPVESLLAACARHLVPTVRYPDDPVAAPFRAGDAVGDVERARAAATDAAGLRDAFHGDREGIDPQWASLVAAAETLDGSVRRTRAEVRRRTGDEAVPTDEDLSGTVAQELAVATERRTASAVRGVERASDDGNYATAVIEAGTALATVEARRRAVEAIRDGGHRNPPSESSLRSAAERAREAVAAVDGGDPLAARFVRPALASLGRVADEVDAGYADPRRTQAELTYAALYARAVPPATAFVRERLG